MKKNCEDNEVAPLEYNNTGEKEITLQKSEDEFV